MIASETSPIPKQETDGMTPHDFMEAVIQDIALEISEKKPGDSASSR